MERTENARTRPVEGASLGTSRREVRCMVDEWRKKERIRETRGVKRDGKEEERWSGEDAR